MVLIASDGELYGHHQPFREKFLSFLLDGALSQTGIKTTFPGLWLLEHPVDQEIEIWENTSWSCMHGIVRWADACSCTPHGEWKKGLREFLNQVGIELDGVYERTAGTWLKDVWQAREDYIHVILGEQDYSQWESEHVSERFSRTDSTSLQQLIKAQVERQRMFTSCGWFFEDFDRIEPRNNLKYAAQAVALSEIASRTKIAEDLLPILKSVTSWKNGASAETFFSTLVEQFKRMAIFV